MGTIRIEQHGRDVHLWIKAVPGASADAIAGPLGERLKVRIAAAAEGGKANTAMCALLARALGCRRSSVTVIAGWSNPEKIVRIADADCAGVRAALVET